MGPRRPGAPPARAVEGGSGKVSWVRSKPSSFLDGPGKRCRQARGGEARDGAARWVQGSVIPEVLGGRRGEHGGWDSAAGAGGRGQPFPHHGRDFFPVASNTLYSLMHCVFSKVNSFISWK